MIIDSYLATVLNKEHCKRWMCY